MRKGDSTKGYTDNLGVISLKSIKSKILVNTLLLVLSALLICFLISYVTLGGMVTLTEEIFSQTEEMSVRESTDMLIGLTTSQAEEITKVCAQTVNVRIDSMFDALRVVSDSVKDIYNDPDGYQMIPFSHPLDAPADEYCIQWVLPENVEMEGNIEEETYKLGNMEFLFRSVLNNHENILSIYFSSANGVNIGFDNTPQTKPMYYDGRTAGWYTTVRDSMGLYISEPYDDSFGRGKMVTLAVPCVSEKGRFCGVCGMDILIEDLNEIISSVNTIEDSYVVLTSAQGVICSTEGMADEADMLFSQKDSGGKTLIETMQSGGSGIKEVAFDDDEMYCAYNSVGFSDWTIVFLIPRDRMLEPSENLKGLLNDSMSSANKDEHEIIGGAALLWILSLAVVALVTVLIVIRMARRISSPIIELSNSVERVGTGDLEYKCDINSEDEIGKLSKSFETMTVSLKEYIDNYTKVTAEKERIGAELNVATRIQADMLPSIFPAFPERHEFDIYATMNPAKEVGGDFYDFFLIDENHLALVMADVSGKGVPAALFMVIAKTLIKNRAQMSKNDEGQYSTAQILSYVNEQLCEGNEEDMFVTVWLGILDIRTGQGIESNAGHEHPAIRRAGGDYELIKTRHSVAVATMDGVKFRENTFELHPGDSLFVYTDGVAEATNSEDELFGTDRMIDALNEKKDCDQKDILFNMKTRIDEFVGDAPQFDDITMLGFAYFGPKDGKE